MENQVTTPLPIFPFEATIEILLRLHVKALLRFRAVCKEWCKVIDSAYFLHLHLSESIRNEMDRSLIITANSENSVIFSLDLKSLEEAVELDVSWWPEDRFYEPCGVNFICSCNGLLCLSSFSTDIALWNPSTRKHLLLPPLIYDDDLQLFIENDSTFSTVVGFGYDSASDDYKVVSINEQINCDDRLVDTEAKVYSLKTNAWQRVHGFPEGQSYQGHGTFLKESIHWLITPSISGIPGLEVTSYHYSIVAFDLTMEKVQIIDIPSSTNDWFAEDIRLHIGIIQGCLSISFFKREVTVDLWILKEYGMVDSWTKLISIDDPNLVPRHQLLPIYYRKISEILLIADTNDESPTEVIWHNSVNQCTTKVPIRGLPDHFYGDELIMESLVRLDSFGH